MEGKCENTELIWFVSFFIGIAILIYRNFPIVRVFLSREKVKVKNASIVLATMTIPFLLARLNNSEIIKILTTLPTVVLAYFAWKAYLTIIQENVYQEQLKEVFNLLNYIESYEIHLECKIPYNNVFQKDINVIKICEPYSEIDIKEDREELNISNKSLTVKNPNGKDIFNTDIIRREKVDSILRIWKNVHNLKYEDMLIKESVLNFFINLSKFRTKPSIPIEISKELENFVVDKDILSVFRKELDNNIESQLNYPYIVVGDQQPTYPVSTIYKIYGSQGSHITYKNWNQLRRSCLLLMKSIEDWLQHNGVKKMNLPKIKKDE